MEEAYSPGYTDPVIAFMGRRTAASHAVFFTALLASGMTVLDCGCGREVSRSVSLALLTPGRVIGIDQEAAQLTLASQQASRQAFTTCLF